MSPRWWRPARREPLIRREGASARAVSLAMLGRFTDELLFGVWAVLGPTLQRVFGLSLVQLGLLDQVLRWVAVLVEPFTASMADLVDRRRLMAAGAFAVGAALWLTGLAPSYPVLLAGAVAYGIGSGPLAHTADLVIVELHPQDAERAFGRATMLDTVGALAGPALVAAAAAVGASWRAVAVLVGSWALAYSWALARQPWPAVAVEAGPSLRVAAANAAHVVRERATRRWISFLWWHHLFEAALILKWVWLADRHDLSQAVIALYATAEQLVMLATLHLLDRRPAGWHPDRVLGRACLALAVLPVLWVTVPGLTLLAAVGLPFAVAQAVVWPLARPRALVEAGARGGALNAVTSLFELAPVAIAVAVGARVVGLGPAMAAVATVSAIGMWLVVANVGRSARPVAGEGPA